MELTAIACRDGEHGGMTAAGALSHYSDSSPIDAELGRRAPQPLQCRIVVFQRPGKASLGSQSVVDCHHHTVELTCQLLQVRDARPGTPQDVATTVYMEDSRPGLAFTPRIDD